MKRISLCALILATAAPLLAQGAWKQLFNGKDFAGWTVPAGGGRAGAPPPATPPSTDPAMRSYADEESAGAKDFGNLYRVLPAVRNATDARDACIGAKTLLVEALLGGTTTMPVRHWAYPEHAAASSEFAVCMVALDVQWLDVGSWPSYAETIDADDAGNRSNAHWCDVGSRGTLVVSEDPAHLIATVGCEDLVIVHTKDATLVCPRAQSERVKELVERVPEKWR